MEDDSAESVCTGRGLEWGWADGVGEVGAGWGWT